MATVCAMILFDALRLDIERSDRRQITSFGRQQLREGMAAHPAWEGKAFEETSFNTVPEDLGEQLEQFRHEDFADGKNWTFRFAGPTKKFRTDKTSRELYLEVEAAAQSAEAAASVPQPQRTALWTAAVVAVLLVLALVVAKRQKPQAGGPQRESVIAVIPFRLLTPDPQLQFLGTGIADSLTSRVSNLEPVRVRPTTAVLRFANSDRDPQVIGRELGADYIVTGTLQQTKGTIRSSVQLMRSSDGTTVWAERFDVPVNDLLTLEDDIAVRVATALHLRLSDEHRARLARAGTHDPAAYEHYLRGRASLLQLTKADTLRAAAEFESAISIDPHFAAARAGLASAAAQMRKAFASREDASRWSARAKQEAGRALELAPQLAEAHEALAAVYRYDEFDWERTMDESDKAIALNSDLELSHDYRSAAAFHLGLIDLAEREAHISMDLDRSRPIEPLRLLGACALARGQWAAAEGLLHEVAQRTDVGEYYEALALFHLNRVADAESMLRREGGGETRRARAGAVLASILAATKRGAEARTLAQQVGRGFVDHHVAYSLGVAYGQLGDQADAMRWLRQAAATGFACYPFYAADPMLTPMHGNADFRQLTGELRQKHDQWANKYR